MAGEKKRGGPVSLSPLSFEDAADGPPRERPEWEEGEVKSAYDDEDARWRTLEQRFPMRKLGAHAWLELPGYRLLRPHGRMQREHYELALEMSHLRDDLDFQGDPSPDD